jgi:hypothetical protein
MRFLSIFLILSFSLLAVFACSNNDDDTSTPEGEGTLEIMFEHKLNGEDLQLGAATEVAGQPVSLSLVRYWVSNIALENSQGEVITFPDGYYLVEETPDNTRKSFQLENVPTGEYTKITFAIGVEEATNASIDAAKGELSVEVGMSWNWNTGYIFLKTEGQFGAENTDFKFHVGTNPNYHSMEFMPEGGLKVKANKMTMLHYEVALESLFEGVSLSETPVVMVGPADTAAKIAKNWSGMYHLHHVQNP